MYDTTSPSACSISSGRQTSMCCLWLPPYRRRLRDGAFRRWHFWILVRNDTPLPSWENPLAVGAFPTDAHRYRTCFGCQRLMSSSLLFWCFEHSERFRDTDCVTCSVDCEMLFWNSQSSSRTLSRVCNRFDMIRQKCVRSLFTLTLLLRCCESFASLLSLMSMSVTFPFRFFSLSSLYKYVSFVPSSSSNLDLPTLLLLCKDCIQVTYFAERLDVVSMQCFIAMISRSCRIWIDSLPRFHGLFRYVRLPVLKLTRTTLWITHAFACLITFPRIFSSAAIPCVQAPELVPVIPDNAEYSGDCSIIAINNWSESFKNFTSRISFCCKQCSWALSQECPPSSAIPWRWRIAVWEDQHSGHCICRFPPRLVAVPCPPAVTSPLTCANGKMSDQLQTTVSEVHLFCEAWALQCFFLPHKEHLRSTLWTLLISGSPSDTTVSCLHLARQCSHETLTQHTHLSSSSFNQKGTVLMSTNLRFFGWSSLIRVSSPWCAYTCVNVWVHFGSILGPFWVHFGSILIIVWTLMHP